jgi:hypothetical protein
MLLVLVPRDLGFAREFFRMLFPLFESIAKGPPVLVDQDQNGIGNFPGQSLITLQVFHAMEHFRVGQVLPLVDESLSQLVHDLIIQVLGSKCGLINDSIARIAFANEMLFHQLH